MAPIWLGRLSMIHTALVDDIGQVARMDPEAFHTFEVRLVSMYRSDEEAQEGIAVALTTINLNAHDAVTRTRLDEIFDMLQHLHDPLLGASISPPHGNRRTTSGP